MPIDSDIALTRLLSICRRGHRFYSEAAEVSRRRKQAVALLKFELQRASLAEELQAWVDAAPGPPTDKLIPLVRGARNDDDRILVLCDEMDRRTIVAYERELARTPGGRLRSVLERHLKVLVAGVELRAGLRRSA